MRLLVAAAILLPVFTAAGQVLDDARYDAVAVGATLEEVRALIPLAPKQISDDGQNVAIYQWKDDAGSGFFARFEAGRLVRKTRLTSPPPVEASAGEVAALEAFNAVIELHEGTGGPEDGGVVTVDGAEVGTWQNLTELLTALRAEQAGMTVSVQAESGVAAARLMQVLELVREAGVQGYYLEPVTEPDAPEATEADLPPVEPPPAAQPPGLIAPPLAPLSQPPRDNRVKVAGSARRARTAEAAPEGVEGSYRPKARLPKHTFSLSRGTFEVRVSNETGSAIEVGLRQGKRGKDISIQQGRAGSFQVDRGDYSLRYNLRDSFS